MSELLLMSGGLDSAAIAVWTRPALLTIDYGQLGAAGELRAASTIAKKLDLSHDVLTTDARGVGAGDLAGVAPVSLRPAGWWPFRNQLLVTLAAAWGLQRGIRTILIGSVREDHRFVDGSPAFVEHLTGLLEMQEGSLSLAAPAIDMTTAELIRTAGLDEALASLTHSCDIGAYACGHCEGCIKRRRVYDELGWQQ